jgi:hypothetical protein
VRGRGVSASQLGRDEITNSLAQCLGPGLLGERLLGQLSEHMVKRGVCLWQLLA